MKKSGLSVFAGTVAAGRLERSDREPRLVDVITRGIDRLGYEPFSRSIDGG